MESLREAVTEHMDLLRGQDTGGEDDAWVKAQLGSLQFVERNLTLRLRRIRGEVSNTSLGRIITRLIN